MIHPSEVCRTAIQKHLSGERYNYDWNTTSNSNFRSIENAKGLFVSLYNNREQRGCLGSYSEKLNTTKDLLKLAILAATRDDRFTPVVPEEIDSLDIAIWAISKLTPVSSLFDLTISPGDLLFIPGGWFHHVKSFEKNIMLTGNFLDPDGFDAFFEIIEKRSGRSDTVNKIKTQVYKSLEGNYEYRDSSL